MKSRDRLSGENAWMHVGFYELLYALVERKAGKAVPIENAKCQAVRRTLGWRMPHVKSAILEQEREEAKALGISQGKLGVTGKRQAKLKMVATVRTVQLANALARSSDENIEEVSVNQDAADAADAAPAESEIGVELDGRGDGTGVLDAQGTADN